MRGEGVSTPQRPFRVPYDRLFLKEQYKITKLPLFILNNYKLTIYMMTV